MSAQHTPGPWTLNFDGTGAFREQDQPYVFVAALGRPLAERKANARLIAAAPELLEALEEILGPLNVCSDNPNVRDDVCLPIEMTMGELRKARAAIAKATTTA
jgi:hypothetical protein